MSSLPDPRPTTRVGTQELDNLLDALSKVTGYLIQHGSPPEKEMAVILVQCANAVINSKRTVRTLP